MNNTMQTTSTSILSRSNVGKENSPSISRQSSRKRRPLAGLAQCILLNLLVQLNQINSQQQSLNETVPTRPGGGGAGAGNVETLRPIFPLQPMAEGPGVDLVALNVRRFELDHDHLGQGSNRDQDHSGRGQLFEEDLTAITNRLMPALPSSDETRQFLESHNMDSSMIADITSVAAMLQPSAADELSPMSMNDPDGASIARLTKSCLTVHASSARPDQLDVKFYLYTKSNQHKAHLLTPQVARGELLNGSPFDPNKPIKWITHGFHTNVDKSEWMVETKDKILQFEDANVILTDWRRGASPALAFYPKAAANAHMVAKFIVRILRRLKDDIDLTQVHLIGHSLGAHIMGFVGSAFTEEHLMRQQHMLSSSASAAAVVRTMFPSRWHNQRQSTKMLIGRITACDPALPCFGPSSSGPVRETTRFGPAAIYRRPRQSLTQPQQQQPHEQRPESTNTRESSMFQIEGGDWTPSMWTHLRPDSAIIVEVMHSNPGVMGYADPLGDFDFFPNGFERQPGCGREQELAPKTPPPSAPVEASPLSYRAGSQVMVPPQPPLYRRRIKRQWSSVMDRFMSTVVHPFLSGGKTSGPPPQPQPQQQAQQPQNYAGLSSARSEVSRFAQTIDKFLNPIKSFFKGNTCSHHRSVEYMVESLYYDRIPQDRKLDRDLVCQMVGYRCQDYASFKKGFCFRCHNADLDCRAFGMSVSPQITDNSLRSNQLALHQLVAPLRSGVLESAARQLNLLNFAKEKFRIHSPELSMQPVNGQATSNNSAGTNMRSLSQQTFGSIRNTTGRVMKRVLPTFDQYNQNYQPQGRNQYFFDTRSNKSFCLHHYNIHVKYRWLRVRDNIILDGFRLLGTLANLSRVTPVQLHKFSYNSYTALLSEPLFLGQIESLILFGSRVKPTLIEYIEITFMSNLDPKIRALGSVKLCRAPYHVGQTTNDKLGDKPNGLDQPPADSLFVRCSGPMVR